MTRQITARAIFLSLLFCLCASSGWAQPNVIQAENAKPGTTDWQLTAPADAPTVEGYASHASVNRGDTIRFFVSSAAPTYTLAIYRIGWYGGAGGRLVHSATLPGSKQATPPVNSITGLIECNWNESYRVTVPNTADKTDWASGIYLAKLTPSAGTQSYIIFVVRDDSSVSPYLFQSAPTTSQAYNNWGGKSLYPYNSTNNAPARKVSFDRPYARSSFWGGAGNFTEWELGFARFMERTGYDVSYITNLDLHANGSLLLRHRSFVAAGHDEYWSYPMKSAAHAARAQGVHLGFFGSNQTYWQVRFEPSAKGEANRTMVGYKDVAQTEDPLALDADRNNDKFITARFRDLESMFGVVDSVAQPENGLVGVMYHGSPFNGDVVVSDPSHWVFAGTGVSNGSRFTGLLGYETDAVADNGYSPPQLRKLSESPDPWGSSHMTTYTTNTGAIVFATGSNQWSWGLDNFSGRNLENEAVKQATRNIFSRFAALPLAVPTNVVSSTSGQSVNLSWSGPAGATSFNVFRSLTAGAQGFTAYRTGLTVPSFTEAGLTNGSYFYKITAANGETESAQSLEVSATLGAAPPPPAPTCTYPSWVEGRQYAAGSIVTYTDGKLYRAKFANPGYNPTISTYFWEAYVCTSTPPPPPPGCSYPNWVDGTPYAAGAIVTYTDGKLYRAKFANPGYNPTVSTYFWEVYFCTTTPPPTPTPTPTPACSYPGWVNGRQYAAGAIVTYTDGKLYRAKFANPGYDPTISTYYWAAYTC